jgi:hypothetical protein
MSSCRRWLVSVSFAICALSPHAAFGQTEHRHHERGAREVRDDTAATPTAGIAWYATLHGDGDADQSGGNDNVLGFGLDGSSKKSVLGPASADIGKVHGLRGVLPLSDGTLLVIAAWKDNTMILRYDRPADEGVRAFRGVFARGGDANQLLLHPYALAVGPDGTIYASNQDSNTVTRYGAPGTPLEGKPLARDGREETGTKTAGLVVPSREMSAKAPDDKHDESGHKSRKNAPHTSAASAGIKEIRGIAFGPDGKLYVADRGDGEVSRWDPATGVREATVASKADGLSTPIQLRFSPDGAALFISDNKENSVFRLSLADGAVKRFIGPDAGLDAPSALAIDGDWLYVGSRKGQAVMRFRLADGTPDAAPFASGLPDNPEYFVRNLR